MTFFDFLLIKIKNKGWIPYPLSLKSKSVKERHATPVDEDKKESVRG
jgi:hypothetical protein